MKIKFIFLFLFGLNLNVYSIEEEKISKDEKPEHIFLILKSMLRVIIDDKSNLQDKSVAKDILKTFLAEKIDIDILPPEVKSLLMHDKILEILKEYYEIAIKKCRETLPTLPTSCIDIIAEYAFYSPDFIDLHDKTKRIEILNKKRKRREPFHEYTGSEKFLDAEILKTTISYSVNSGDFSLIKYLIESGADVNSVDKNGMPLLADAIKSRSLKMIRFLLENKADPNYIFKDYIYYNYLLFLVYNTPTSAHKFILEVIKLFIEYKINVNWTEDTPQVTILIRCAFCGYFDCIKVLVEAGADVNIRDNKGKKASHIAYEQGHNDIGDFLIEREILNTNL